MCPAEKSQNNAAKKVASYPAPLDAVVLAGTDHNPRRLIANRNKAFLEVGGRVLVHHVMEALLGSSSIGHIYLVGPAQQLGKIFPAPSPRITIMDQAGTMLSSSRAAVRACETRHASENDVPAEKRPMLFISCDLPLISPRAVDDFVARCAQEDLAAAKPYSLLVGVAEAASLRPFYPEDGKPGIIRPYMHLSSGRLRLANIYVCRPHGLLRQEFLQIGFSYRKASDWRNVLLLVWSFFGQSGGWYAAWLTLRLQATLMAARYKGPLYHRLRRGNTPEKIERACSNVLGGPVRIVTTPCGGLSLDVDDEEDYRVLDQRFSDWSALGTVSE
jgi:molybdopterin-guanine dinucleotide biosynthesis protein A